MSAIVTTVSVLLACILVIGLLWRVVVRRRRKLIAPLSLASAPSRKLSAEERQAIELYLRQSAAEYTDPRNSDIRLTLAPQGDDVYPLTLAITRYRLNNQWHYYLDAAEVHLPPAWESHINEDNRVELIRTQTLPLVISLNGHRIQDYPFRDALAAPTPSDNGSSIRQDESEHVELVRVRKETPAEYRLSQPIGISEAGAISAALLLLFFSLLTPIALVPWLIGSTLLLLIWSLWSLFRRPQEKHLREIHCLRGTLKRWGVFGELHQGQNSNISLGAIDLIYPPHWQPYLAHDLGKKTRVDIYLDRQVVSQGSFLSLHEEAQRFPLQHWRHNAVLFGGALMVLLLLVGNMSLGLPLKLSIAWLQGAQRVQATSVATLENHPLHIGDILQVQGSGMCQVQPSRERVPSSNAFYPFDCSSVYWNNTEPLAVPRSEIVEKASALLTSVHQQLHPSDGERRVNPQLASVIQKSGMILLDDFTGIVLKTEALCSESDECLRLKNALVNLGNAKNWNALVKLAQSSTLQGTNVLLRPVSAESLENIVTNVTATFFEREFNLAVASLSNLPPGGFLLQSEEGRPLVSYPLHSPSIEHDAVEQWQALQRLSGLLLNTPFIAEGIVTDVNIDSNGTHRISLHGEPDANTLWHYLGTSLLLLLLCGIILVNLWLWLKRLHRNQQRRIEIQNYYDNCFNLSLSPLPLRSFF